MNDNLITVDFCTQIDALRTLPTPYPYQQQAFLDFAEARHENPVEVMPLYLDQVEGKNATWNQHAKAVKHLMRHVADHMDLTDSQRLAVNRTLESIKMRSQPKANTEDKVPTPAEVKEIIEAADNRLSLMIQFLWETSCRISEMLDAKLADVRSGKRVTHIRVNGKGRKERDLRLSSALYQAIRKEFRGKEFVFEHSGRPYSRVAVTNRIRQIAMVAVGKPVTAHMIRHARGTLLSERLGISKASSELGHQDIRTTKAYYDHTVVTEEEFLDTLQ